MLLFLTSLAYAQDAGPERPAWSQIDGLNTRYDYPGGRTPEIGSLHSRGYCERRRDGLSIGGPTKTGYQPSLFKPNSPKLVPVHSVAIDDVIAVEAEGMIVCIELALGPKGSDKARWKLGYDRAHTLAKWPTRSASASDTLIVVLTDTSEDPEIEAGELQWTAWKSYAHDGPPPVADDDDALLSFENDVLPSAVAAEPVDSRDDGPAEAPSPAPNFGSFDEWLKPKSSTPPPPPPPPPASTPTVTATTPKPTATTSSSVATPKTAESTVKTAVVVAAPQPVAPAIATPAALVLPSIDGRLATGKKAKNEAAVVIGLEDYAFVPDVPYASRDADAFYNFLLYTRGVPRDRIAMLKSGSVEHIRRAVEDAGKSVGTGGTVWVYFAGHGAASPSTRQQVVLGDDARPDDISFDARSVPVADIQRLATSGGGDAMLVVDACFSGVGRGGSSLLGGARTLVPAKALQAVAAARQWSGTSAGEASVPLESVQHGAFTYAAIGALRGWADGELGERDGKVTADEADAYVARLLRAVQVREQSPQFLGGTAVVLSEGATETGPVLE